MDECGYLWIQWLVSVVVWFGLFLVVGKTVAKDGTVLGRKAESRKAEEADEEDGEDGMEMPQFGHGRLPHFAELEPGEVSPAGGRSDSPHFAVLEAGAVPLKGPELKAAAVPVPGETREGARTRSAGISENDQLNSPWWIAREIVSLIHAALVTLMSAAAIVCYIVAWFGNSATVLREPPTSLHTAWDQAASLPQNLANFLTGHAITALTAYMLSDTVSAICCWRWGKRHGAKQPDWMFLCFHHLFSLVVGMAFRGFFKFAGPKDLHGMKAPVVGAMMVLLEVSTVPLHLWFLAKGRGFPWMPTMRSVYWVLFTYVRPLIMVVAAALMCWLCRDMSLLFFVVGALLNSVLFGMGVWHSVGANKDGLWEWIRSPPHIGQSKIWADYRMQICAFSSLLVFLALEVGGFMWAKALWSKSQTKTF